VKVLVAILCGLALLAVPVMARVSLMAEAPAGCCKHSGLPGEGRAHHHRGSGQASSCCSLLCADSCGVALPLAHFWFAAPIVASVEWQIFSPLGPERSERPPVPPPREFTIV
jgi:hypothetical protein